MKNSDIRQLNNADLAAKIKEETSALHSLEFDHRVTPLQNPMSIRITRRLVARLKTEQGARVKTANSK
ncbi:MAG: 50S ribosomal protein L29 [Cytophagales bacterium]|nr:MAG: 50S ribosomal protein L29 [Cytophagales bacterium]TAF62445.1 MAG: 50S ribosomal protein L29 [Cytophagales bacterium]